MTKEDAIAMLNRIAAGYGLGGGRHKRSSILYSPPKDWKGIRYFFGYTPWKTKDPETGKEGFFALKYRHMKKGNWMQLVKKVRFGKRKIARKRANIWYAHYYYRKNYEMKEAEAPEELQNHGDKN